MTTHLNQAALILLIDRRVMIKKNSPPKKPPQERPDAKKAPSATPSKTGEPEDSGHSENLTPTFVRNDFYRDGYRTLLKVSLVESIVILGLIGAIFFVIHTHQPENRYFATTEDGRLIPMVALSQPNLSAPALMSWVAQSATEVMTFNFNDYRQRLQEASRNFTRQGWGSFTRALQNSRIIETVEQYQQIVTAAPRGAPILQSEGLVAGRYQWIIKIPMVITYQSGSKTRADNLMVTMVVVRVPRLESPNGVGIEQWIAAPG